MFTGLVETTGEIATVAPEGPGARLTVTQATVAAGANLGDSICVSGCCLTVVEATAETVTFQAGEETLNRTHFCSLQAGSLVNLERSLKVGDELGGHFVTGHIDAVGRLAERQDDEEWSTFWFEVPPELTRQMISKGSVAVDGVSLTLVDVTDDRFSVALIPHTLEVTTLGRLAVGDPVNIETDVLAKYVEKQLASKVKS